MLIHSHTTQVDSKGVWLASQCLYYLSFSEPHGASVQENPIAAPSVSLPTIAARQVKSGGNNLEGSWSR